MYLGFSCFLDGRKEGLSSIQKAHIGCFVEEREIRDQSIRKSCRPELGYRSSRRIGVSNVVSKDEAGHVSVAMLLCLLLNAKDEAQ